MQPFSLAEQASECTGACACNKTVNEPLWLLRARRCESISGCTDLCHVYAALFVNLAALISETIDTCHAVSADQVGAKKYI